MLPQSTVRIFRLVRTAAVLLILLPAYRALADEKPGKCQAERLLTAASTDVTVEASTVEDPISLAEMQQARSMVNAIQPFIQDWHYTVEDLSAEKVATSLQAMRQSGLDIDGEGFRNLFLVMERYLLVSKGSDGRLRPLSEVLEASEGKVRRAVNFLTQLDTLASIDQMTDLWPVFLRLSSSPIEFIQWEYTRQGLFADASHPRAFRPEVKAYLNQTVARVLGTRVRYARLRINPQGNQLTLLSPVAMYKINLHLGPVDRRSIAPLLVQATVAWGRANDKVINAKVDVSLVDDESTSYLRTLIRADAFLHPHLIPPSLELFPQPVQGSEVQQGAVRSLMKMDAAMTEVQTAYEPLVLGLEAPTGEGKTVMIADYIRQLQSSRWTGRRAKIVLVVENCQILQQTVESFKRDLGLDPQRIAMLFGETEAVCMGSGAGRFLIPRGSTLSPPVDFDLVVITRSTYFQRLSSVRFWIENENRKSKETRRPFMVLIDEAHHIGTEWGQYKQIIDGLKADLIPEDRILLVSATLWHAEQNIVRDVLKGAVVATHLLEDELRVMQRGENLENLARTQFLRAIIEGYVDPIEDGSIALVDGTWTSHDLRQRLGRREIADSELYDFVADMIRKMRVPGIMDRFLFFEVRQERAEEGAEYLQKNLGNARDFREAHRAAWFMHSGLPMSEQAQHMDWFRDRNEFRGSRFQHKYLATVGQLLEGVDIRGVNGIAIMRNLSSNRLVQQVLGRGARLEPFKTGLRLIDVPGRTVAYLEDAGELWDHASYRSPTMVEGWNQQSDEKLWDEPVAAPLKIEVTARVIDLEPAFRRERAQLIQWQNVDPSEISPFLAADGASRLLSYNPNSWSAQDQVQLKSWFQFWNNKLPDDVRVQWAAQWDALNLSDEPVAIGQLSDAQATSALRAFHLLAKIFNGMALVDRLGLAEIEPSERALGVGQSRVLAVLDPKYNFQTVYRISVQGNSVIQVQKNTPEQAKVLRLALRDEEILSGMRPQGFTEAAEGLKRGPAAILAAVSDLIRVRPALRTAPAVQILRIADYYMANGGDKGLIAGYYLGVLMNQYLADARLTSQKPWNLNGYYGLTAGQNYLDGEVINRPSEYDVWTTLDLVEFQLKKRPL